MELQQQVQGMGNQLASLEASLKASDAQVSSLRQEVASSGNSGPPIFKVNGREVNGGASANLPKGFYYSLADQAPAGEAAQEAAPQPHDQSNDSAESNPGAAAPQSGIGSSIPVQLQSTIISSQGQGLSNEREQKLDEALLAGEGSEAIASGSTSHSRAVQPGMQVCGMWFT